MAHPKHGTQGSHPKQGEHQGKHADPKHGSAQEHEKKSKDKDGCGSCK